jgi:hypothetical protein
VEAARNLQDQASSGDDPLTAHAALIDRIEELQANLHAHLSNSEDGTARLGARS